MRAFRGRFGSGPNSHWRRSRSSLTRSGRVLYWPTGTPIRMLGRAILGNPVAQFARGQGANQNDNQPFIDSIGSHTKVMSLRSKWAAGKARGGWKAKPGGKYADRVLLFKDSSALCFEKTMNFVARKTMPFQPLLPQKQSLRCARRAAVAVLRAIRCNARDFRSCPPLRTAL